MSADPIRIDFVSDIACPWCAVGLGALEQALQNLGDAVTVDISKLRTRLFSEFAH